jgi:cytochrome c oxidase cbb3-type subunit 3
MPTKVEKDTFSGRETTGHEWDGLKELNTPLPKWWLYVFAATVVWAIVLMVLYPSVPYITGHTHGLLGYSQRARVDTEVKTLVAQRAAYMDRIAAMPIEQVRQDPQLYAMALTAGRIAFANNCQPCHGQGGAGRPGYPNLADDVWIWGGRLGDIERTITHGVRSGDPDAHMSQMPRFGADNILKPEQVQLVADYVMTLFGHPAPAGGVAAGAKIFAENCAACHGANGEGNREVGAPPLRSHTHLYEDSRAAIVAQITNPRMGVMPNWNTRLDTATIRSLALYVHSLGGGE